MHRLGILTLVMLMFAAGMMAPTAHAQHRNNLIMCTPTAGPYAGQELFMRYDGQADTLYLMSYFQNDPLAVIQTGLDTTQFDVRGWGNGCQYLIASLGPWGEQEVAAWDILTPRLIDRFRTIGLSYQRNRGLTSGWLVVQSLAGAYVWHLPTNTRWQIATASDGMGVNLYSASIDVERNRMLFVSRDDYRLLTVFDLSTGQVMAQYRGNREAEPVGGYWLRENPDYLSMRGKYEWVVYYVPTNSAYVMPIRTYTHSYTRDEVTTTYVSIYDNGDGYRFSDDGRYFIMWDFPSVRVWDVTQPRAAGQQIPLHEWPLHYTQAVRLLDNQTLEVLEYVYPDSAYRGFHYWRYALGSGAVLAELMGAGIECDYPTLRDPSLDDLTWRWICQERGYR